MSVKHPWADFLAYIRQTMPVYKAGETPEPRDWDLSWACCDDEHVEPIYEESEADV
jgi:hypothetical protein